MMLSVMRECRNFFEVSGESGEFEIQNGIIGLKGPYLAGQYILIVGSARSDGVYLLKDTLYTLEGARDESFTGTVYGLAVPPDFVKLCDEIRAFTESAAGKSSNITSETVLGVHSWSAATDKSGVPAGWQSVFAQKLKPFRKMFSKVAV